MFRGRPGVARGGAEDVEGLVTPLKLVFEELAEQLHRHVLERCGRSVGQLRQVESTPQRSHRHDGRVAERRDGIGTLAQRTELGVGDVVHEQPDDGVGQGGIPLLGEDATPRAPGRGIDDGVCRGQVQTAIGRQSLQQDVAERQTGGAGGGAGGDVTGGRGLDHRGTP